MTTPKTGAESIAEIAAELKPDYDAAAGMADLQMMALMMASGRDELALKCVNRVNAFLWKLSNPPELQALKNAELEAHMKVCVDPAAHRND